MSVIKCGNCGKVSEGTEFVPYGRYKCELCGALNEVTNVSIQEWIGFNFQNYLSYILSAVETDGFTNLLATTQQDLDAGMLSSVQVQKLKNILGEGFEEGYNIRQIRNAIQNTVRPGDLYRRDEDGNIIMRDGNPVIQSYGNARSLSIARSETTRLSSKGVLNYYGDNLVNNVSFVASLGARTCDVCASLNGRIFTIEEAQGIIPIHSNCRCMFVAV